MRPGRPKPSSRSTIGCSAVRRPANQYAPSTPQVLKRPLLIVPPWINKFYILDLNPEKSFIRWCVAQGLTVFCISWVNPDARHAAKDFESYMREGIFAAQGLPDGRLIVSTGRVYDQVSYQVLAPGESTFAPIDGFPSIDTGPTMDLRDGVWGLVGTDGSWTPLPF